MYGCIKRINNIQFSMKKARAENTECEGMCV